MNANFAALVDFVAGAEVLSLDVFDTALVRTVGEPVDVFTLVAKEYRHRKCDTMRSFDFALERRLAEMRRRGHVWLAEQRGDIVLDEIYDELQTPPDWDKTELKALELDVERLVCRPNPWIFDLYREALRLGLQVVFISDMYLPATFIGELLDRAGYTERKALWVSSNEGGISKGSGALYRRARQALGPARIAHIGDNSVSDVAMAVRNGWGALLYYRCGQLLDAHGWRHPSHEPAAMVHRGLVALRLYAHRGLSPTMDAFYRFGYDTVGLAWWLSNGDPVALATALGARDSVVELAAHLASPAAGDPRFAEVRRGASDFAADFLRHREQLGWLQPSWHCVALPFIAFGSRVGTKVSQASLAEQIASVYE